MNANEAKKAYVAPSITGHGDVVARTLGPIDQGSELNGRLAQDQL